MVTLIEKREFDLLKVRDLPTKVRDRHVEWWHLPIQDGKSPPARGFEDRWAVAGEALRDRLRLGFDVLVHCRGGLGRAGTVAARLLVELGAHPDRAIRSVRDVRPGALETEDQEDHVAQCSARPPTAPSKDPESIRDRALGAFLGLAVGDAVGTTLEFCSRDAQPRLEDMVGGGPFDLPPGYWTDDTAMALALADSLAASETLPETLPGAEGALGVAGAFHRPVPAAERSDTGRGRTRRARRTASREARRSCEASWCRMPPRQIIVAPAPRRSVYRASRCRFIFSTLLNGRPHRLGPRCHATEKTDPLGQGGGQQMKGCEDVGPWGAGGGGEATGHRR